MAITWSAEYGIGHSDIDADHEQLVRLLGRLERLDGGESAEVLSVLEQLSVYVVEHFQREERLLEQADCPFLADHMAMHEAFAADIAEVVADQASAAAIDPQLGPALASALARWLRHHILVEDRRCAEYLVADKQK